MPRLNIDYRMLVVYPFANSGVNTRSVATHASPQPTEDASVGLAKHHVWCILDLIQGHFHGPRF